MCIQYIHKPIQTTYEQTFHVSCFLGELGFESFSDRFPSIILLLMLIWAATVSTTVCCTGRGTNPVSWWIAWAAEAFASLACTLIQYIYIYVYIWKINRDIFKVAKTPPPRQVFFCDHNRQILIVTTMLRTYKKYPSKLCSPRCFTKWVRMQSAMPSAVQRMHPTVRKWFWFSPLCGRSTLAATGVRDVFVPPELLDLEIICFSSNSVYRGYTPRRNPFKTHGRKIFLAADAPASKGFGKCMFFSIQ